MTATTELQGLVLDLPDAEYRQAPGLSSTGIKRLLDSPARYQWEQTHRTDKRAFDLGHVVHAVVLGAGLDVAVIDHPDYRTKAAREERDAARAEGRAPILAHEWEQVEVMAAAVREHPDAGPLLTGGEPEVSLFWDDPETGVACKGRLDYWHRSGVVVDLKSTGRTADPRRVDRLAYDLGWHQQAAHYSAGVEVVTGARPRFIHVVLEVDAPHFVAVVELDDEYLELGRQDVRLATDAYAACLAADDWPAYPPGIHRIAPPRYARAATDLEIA